jgi:hypothetical protein
VDIDEIEYEGSFTRTRTRSRRSKTKKDNMEVNYKDYILQGERYLKVQAYTYQVMLTSLLLNDQLVGQVQGTHYPLRLRLFFLSINMLNTLIKLRQVPKKIGRENIVLSFPYYMPKLKDVEFNNKSQQ